MKKIFLLVIIFAGIYHAGYCQSADILNNDSMLQDALTRTQYEIDPNAKAVILFEKGYCKLEGESYEYNYEITAKILSDDAASDLAQVIISKLDNSEIINIHAESYNLENGRIIKHKLEDEDILKDKIRKGLKVFKFNIPEVRKGTVIHYSYTLFKTADIRLPEWDFQNPYPTLSSRFSLMLPVNISFNKIIRSRKHFVDVKHAEDLDTCDACEYTVQNDRQVTHTRWSIKNIPAYQQEPFSGSPDNFKERIKIMITNVYYPGGGKQRIFDNWADFSRRYLYGSGDYIGQVFKPNSFLDETVKSITQSSLANMDKAKAIYAYVRSNYDWDENSDENIRSVFRTRKGNVFGINLLLVAMMKNAGLDCDPIVLSTKDNERLSDQYPNPYDLNYLVAYFKDKDKDYFLDASSSFLPFGALKPECYNGYARIINKQGAAITLSPDSINDRTVTMVHIAPSEHADLVLKVDLKLGIYKSIDFRKAFVADSSEAIKSIKRSLAQNSLNLVSGSLTFKNLDDPDLPVSVHYEATLPLDRITDLFYFDPYFMKFYDKNPFIAADRALPIAFDYREEYNYTLNFKLPDGYKIDDLPTPTNIRLGEDGGITFSNLFDYSASDNLFSLSCRFKINTTTFSPNDYNNIRQIFEKVIAEQNKKIVLTKK
jgi:hypothetical protein